MAVEAFADHRQFYNVTGGYVEGIVRGYRNQLLTQQNYSNLTQCETVDGKSALYDIGSFMLKMACRCQTPTRTRIWRLSGLTVCTSILALHSERRSMLTR